MCSGVWGDMYDGHWVGAEGVRIVTLVERVNRKWIPGGRDYGISSPVCSRCLGSSSVLSKFNSLDTDVAGSDLSPECPVGSLVHLGSGDESESGAEKLKHLSLNIVGLV